MDPSESVNNLSRGVLQSYSGSGDQTFRKRVGCSEVGPQGHLLVKSPFFHHFASPLGLLAPLSTCCLDSTVQEFVRRFNHSDWPLSESRDHLGTSGPSFSISDRRTLNTMRRAFLEGSAPRTWSIV